MNIYTRTGTLIGEVTPIDATPTQSSTNAVQSGGVYTAIDGASGGDSVVIKAKTNLFDKNSAVLGDVDSSGVVVESSAYYVSDFTEVEYGQKYIGYNCYRVAYYTGAKAFISRARVYVNQLLTIPETAVFMRIVAEVANVDTAICADVRYFDPNYNGEVITGIASPVVSATRKGLGQYAEDNIDQFSVSENMFDYEHDYYQISNNQYGVNTATGEFKYTSDHIVTRDEDFYNNTYIGIEKFFPISEGEVITCNYAFNCAFYDESKTYLSNATRETPYEGATAPEDVAFVRLNVYGSSDGTLTGRIHSIAEIADIIIFKKVYKDVNILSPKWHYNLPHYQLDGTGMSANYLDKVRPNMIDSEFLSAMKCMAIREINAREHAWRFGNFNIWVGQDTKGYNMIKKMLMDCGIDFCGFEEVMRAHSNRPFDLAEFLRSWQFADGFIADRTASIMTNQSFVSRFPITSMSEAMFESGPDTANGKYINCKIELPRYLDIVNAKRILSVYVIHPPITTSYLAPMAQELLGILAQDTSDFIIVMGDTNDFGGTMETKTFWQPMIQGGYKTVIPITTKTVTRDTWTNPETGYPTRSIDQFFISDNIDVIGFNVINTKDNYAIPDSSVNSETDNKPCLSDHDFVYCDLKFDYNKVRSGLAQTEGE